MQDGNSILWNMSLADDNGIQRFCVIVANYRNSFDWSINLCRVVSGKLREYNVNIIHSEELAPFVERPSAWWRHEMMTSSMETFYALLALCAGNSPVPVNSPHKGQWRWVLMLYLIYAWINDWVNNHKAGDLRHHRGHNDVIVMACLTFTA